MCYPHENFQMFQSPHITCITRSQNMTNQQNEIEGRKHIWKITHQSKQQQVMQCGQKIWPWGYLLASPEVQSPCPIHESCTDVPCSRIFPCIQPQQSRGLMVRANQNKSHRSNKGVRMYRKIMRMTALHDFQQVLAKKSSKD